MALRDRLREASHWLAEAVYTPMCAECNRRGTWVCDECRAGVRPIRKPGCERCGVLHTDDCECAWLPEEIERLHSVYPYGGWVRSSIHRLKYDGEFARAESLASEFDRVQGALGPVDIIVPVPIHKRRLRERGFNQALLIARHVGAAWDVPVSEALTRDTDNGRQVGKAREERWQNVTGIFSTCDPHAILGKRVVVLDDVVTTGATVSMCAAELRAAGASSVIGLSLARG